MLLIRGSNASQKKNMNAVIQHIVNKDICKSMHMIHQLDLLKKIK